MNNTTEYLAATGQISVETYDEIATPEDCMGWAVIACVIALALVLAAAVGLVLYFSL